MAIAAALPVASNVSAIGIHGSSILTLQHTGLIDHVRRQPLPLIMRGVEDIEGMFVVTFKACTGACKHQIIVAGRRPATTAVSISAVRWRFRNRTGGAAAGCFNPDVAWHDLS